MFRYSRNKQLKYQNKVLLLKVITDNKNKYRSVTISHISLLSDNVGLHIDGVLYVRVVDPYKSSYGVEDPEYAVTQLAQTTMRSEIGKQP